MVADGHGHSEAGEHNHADEPMLSLEAVQKLVLERSGPLGLRLIGVEEALGYVLAEEAIVGQDIPPFENSAMDGYAVVSSDTRPAPVDLLVSGIVAAGSPPPPEPLAPGHALQIMTGAVMPAGADAVAIVERTERLGEATVRILDEVLPGANVRRVGSDFRAGSVALTAGVRLGPAQVGILCSVGVTDVPVWRKPRVGVMSTGDELVRGGGPLAPGQIRDSNRPTLLGLVRRDGYEAIDLGVIGDSAADIDAALDSALGRCDVVLSSGGVSKGEFDYVKVVLDKLATDRGGEYMELAVAIRPGKPLALAWLPRSAGSDERVAFFGLPGNPVSAIVSYEVIAAPVLRYMAGVPSPLPRPVRGVAAQELRASRDGRINLIRVEVAFGPDGVLAVRSAGGQQSHQLSAMSSANGLAMLASGSEIGTGDPVDVLIFGPIA